MYKHYNRKKMRKNLLIICIVILSGCKPVHNEISIRHDQVYYSCGSHHLNGIIPYINSSRLEFKAIVPGTDKITVKYLYRKENAEIALEISTQNHDSICFGQISAVIPGKLKWSENDTLKVLITDSDSIENGMISRVYGPVYCWCKPEKFTDFKSIEPGNGIQVAYWKFTHKDYCVLLPMGGNGFAFSLGKSEPGFGAVGLTRCNEDLTGKIPVLSWAIGPDIYKLLPSLYSMSFEKMGISGNLRINKKLDDMYNYLGWASWNAFQHDVNESKIMDAAKSLKNEDIPVRWFLIDDGWLDTENNKLRSFYPDKTKFPVGFNQLTTTLKKDFDIEDIGVWHTLNGYWEGIKPGSRLQTLFPDILKYRDRIVWLSDTVTTFQFVNPFSEDGPKFYDNWYQILQSQGISFIKVDNQLVVQKISGGNFPIWQTGEKMYNNLYSAAGKYFGGSVINCMEMVNAAYYHYSNSSLARASEDFNPAGNKYSLEFNGNAAAHILACFHNSFWFSNMVWPDFDMFQSSHPDAFFYALAKIMSGGPVYITDEPGKHNAALLRSLTFSDGKIIKAGEPGMPVEGSLFQLFDSDKPFQVFSRYNGSGLLAAWNVSPADSVFGTFTPSSVRDLTGNTFVIFDFRNKMVSEKLRDDTITGFTEENGL